MRKKKLSTMLASILIASVLMGCSLFTNLAERVSGLVNAPTATPPDPAAALEKYTDEEIRTGIQKTVDSYAQAYNTNDIELLTSITDPDNLPFKRMVLNRFTATMESIHGGSYGFDLTVKEVKRMPLGFVQAHIDTGWDYVFDWQFRLLDKQWVLSRTFRRPIGGTLPKRDRTLRL